MTELKLHKQNYINGQWIDGVSSTPVINPVTEQPFAEVARGTTADVDRAVDASTEAFKSWSKLSGTERAVYIRKMASYIRDNLEDLIAIQQTNSGKPRQEAINDITDSADAMDYYADQAEKLDQRQYEFAYELPNQKSEVRYEAMGPVGFILPWNFPMKLCSWKLGPALAAGCTVVIKPASVTPFIENEWAAAAEAAGLPAGVVNVVNGPGREIGDAISSHPDLRKVSFTGSTPTGIGIMKKAAETVKNIGLELGGKSSIIVFDDADLDLAARLVDEGIFYNCGQCCNATSRLLVQEEIAPKLLERIKAIAENKIIGGPENPEAQMGPQTSAGQYSTVANYMEIAKQEGLNLLTGGGRPAGFDQGYFLEPTVYTDVPETSRLWMEEIFGPILCVRTFKTTEEAIDGANNSEFGLAGTVVTESDKTATAVVEGVETGHIYHNTSVCIRPESSWGGFKQSGIGRELGPWGFSGFLEVKMITSRR